MIRESKIKDSKLGFFESCTLDRSIFDPFSQDKTGLKLTLARSFVGPNRFNSLKVSLLCFKIKGNDSDELL